MRALGLRAAWALTPLLLLTTLACPKADKADAGRTGPDAAAQVGPIAPHRGDLDVIREKGALRVAAVRHAAAYLPTGPSREADERALVEAFARARGLGLVWVPRDTAQAALDAVRAGEADLAASRLTVTRQRARTLAFTRALWVTDEVFVSAGKGGAGGAPPEGARVLVPRGASYVESLADFAKTRPDLVVEEEVASDVDLAERVARANDPRLLTVLDEDTLRDVERFLDVRALSTLRRGVKIAWAARKTAPRLVAAANAFLVERALTTSARAPFFGDLDAIQRRGVLRMITRNNGVTYYLHKGAPRGFDYALASAFARSIGVRLQVVLPRPGETLLDALEAGRGDVVAASMTVTEARKKRARFSVPYLHTDELLVARKGDATAPRALGQLKGRVVVVRAGSSYEATLRALPPGVRPEIRTVPTEVETEDLLAQLRAGAIDLTVADAHFVALERALDDAIEPVLALSQAGPDKRDVIGKPAPGAKDIAFAVRKDAVKLEAALSAWVRKTYRGTFYNTVKRAAFGKGAGAAAHAQAHMTGGGLSPYDAAIQRAAAEVGLDWRLLAAQAFQESRFDPRAKSWVGARGLFQLMPATFAELAAQYGLRDITDVDDNARAAAHYLSWLMQRFEPRLPLATRLHFALASYNAGLGHVQDARRLARQLGRSGDAWFGDVADALRKLKQPAFYKKARYGYCRGDEPVAYVAAIQDRYDQYRQLTKGAAPQPPSAPSAPSGP